jgi:hypothetical protein
MGFDLATTGQLRMIELRAERGGRTLDDIDVYCQEHYAKPLGDLNKPEAARLYHDIGTWPHRETLLQATLVGVTDA